MAPTLLLVDDDAAIIRVTSRALGALGDVIACGSPCEAIERLAGHDGRLDLVVSDIQMPVMSGVDMARVLARARPGLPVLFVSGTGIPADLTDDLPFPWRFLPKPFSVSQLLDACRGLLPAV
jgi:CheY-like chemotaxis protein